MNSKMDPGMAKAQTGKATTTTRAAPTAKKTKENKQRKTTTAEVVKDMAKVADEVVENDEEAARVGAKQFPQTALRPVALLCIQARTAL